MAKKARFIYCKKTHIMCVCDDDDAAVSIIHDLCFWAVIGFVAKDNRGYVVHLVNKQNSFFYKWYSLFYKQNSFSYKWFSLFYKRNLSSYK